MNKQNRELATATVVLSAVAVGLNGLSILACGLIFLFSFITTNQLFESSATIGGVSGPTSIYMTSSGFSDFFGIFSAFIVVIAIISLLLLALKIVALVFAVKGKNQNNRKYVLVAAILNMVNVATMNLLSIAAAICGFILFDAMGKEKLPNIESGGVDKNQQTEENIYAMIK